MDNGVTMDRGGIEDIDDEYKFSLGRQREDNA